MLMKSKNAGVALDIKALGEDGTIEGYASMFGVVDSYNEAVAPGAFKGSLAAAKREKRTIKMLYQHDTWQPIGVWDELIEDDKGLRVAGRLLIEESPKALEVYGLIKAGALDELSIGYREIETTPDRQNDGVTILKKLDLREVSIVTFGALGRAARIDGVKQWADGELPTVREFETALRELGLSRSKAAAMATACAPHLRGEPEAVVDDAARRFLEALRA